MLLVIKKPIAILFCITFIHSCSTTKKQNISEYHDKSYDYHKFYKKISYDKRKLPLFENELRRTPTASHATCNVVFYKNDKPQIIYHTIMIGDKKKRTSSKVRFKYTRKANKLAMTAGKNALKASNYSGRPQNVIVYFGTVVLTFTVIQTGGILIDLMRSPYLAYKSIKNNSDYPKESVIAFTTFKYDEKGRLQRVMMFASSEPPEPLYHIQYRYRSRSQKPYRAKVEYYNDSNQDLNGIFLKKR